jgi:thioester reductase-like protein
VTTQPVLLTGGTGLLGSYLLRDLLSRAVPIAVLARPKGKDSAAARVEQVLAHWDAELGRRLPRPLVLEGDVTSPGLGLDAAARGWAADRRPAVLHGAASLTFVGADRAREPWLSNLTGTANVLAFCRDARLRELHYVSTAYVCGTRPGPVREDDPDYGPAFRNDYERSKSEAEGLVRSADFLDRVTVYRPAIIVGDWRTGYTTTYHGLYPYLHFAWILSRHAPREADGRWHAPVRLNLTGNERRNLVPVDWVSAALTELLLNSRHHGRTYHLTPTEPTTAREIEEAMAAHFNYYGPTFVGPDGLAGGMNELEEAFYAQVEQYAPYWSAEPAFDATNTRAALPGLPCPRVDRACLHRLIDFAIADQWGKRRR